MIIDLLIILTFIIGIYLGFQSGFLKTIIDFIIFFISSFLAVVFSDALVDRIYKYFPFINFYGKSQNIKAINLIFWKLILFIIIVIVLVVSFKAILKALKINEKIEENILSANLISKILGAISSIMVSTIIIFDINLFLLSPNFNINQILSSNISYSIMNNTPVLSKANEKLYENEKWIITKINMEEDKVKINNDIINHIINTKLISPSKVKEIKYKIIITEEDIKDASQDSIKTTTADISTITTVGTTTN